MIPYHSFAGQSIQSQKDERCFTLFCTTISGTCMMLGASYWRKGYGVSASPSISNDSNYCYLVFYYKLWKKGRANLTISIEESNGNKWTVLWSANDTMDYWKKEVITLPKTSFNYSIIFFGFFQSHGYVSIDDMDLIQCGLCKLLHIISSPIEIFCPRAIGLNAHVTLS